MSKIILDPNSEYIEDYLFFENPFLYDLSHRQVNDMTALSEFINWGRRNPVLFAEEIFGIEMLDYQKYIFMNTWNAQFSVWLMARNGGKSIMGAVYLMTRSLLVPNFSAYILCNVGSQSIELFTKLEKLAFNEIPSFTTLTDVYRGEVIRNASNSNGFIHNPSSYHTSLYNGSGIFTLNGAYNNNRSKRSNCNFYDEAGFSDDELFRTSEPFISQSSEFKMGVGQDNDSLLMEPTPFPNQLIYASSAGSREQYLYTKYREASIHMDAGDPRYFCIDLTADTILNATQRGIPLAKPLLTREVIESRLREDKVAGMREYYNDFEIEEKDRQIVTRADILRNSVPRVPDLKNPDGKRKYVIAYDPARLADNSVIGIGEVWQDPAVGWRMKIVNFISLVDIFKAKKTPMNTPAQIEELKRIILDYNGEGVADYENISAILVDAGSGGAGVPITDFLCEDWVDENGNTHRGIIDNNYNEGDKSKYPNAINGLLNLVSPRKYKPELFEALIKMMELNLIEFPEEYLDKGYVNLIYENHPNGKKVQRYKFPSEDEEEALRKQGVEIVLSPAHLTKAEEAALKQIDLMKGEIINIYRYKQAGEQDRFDLAPEKTNVMHDDRAYVLALLAWQLSLLRRERVLNKKREKKSDLGSQLPIRTGKITKAIG